MSHINYFSCKMKLYCVHRLLVYASTTNEWRSYTTGDVLEETIVSIKLQLRITVSLVLLVSRTINIKFVMGSLFHYGFVIVAGFTYFQHKVYLMVVNI